MHDLANSLSNANTLNKPGFREQRRRLGDSNEKKDDNTVDDFNNFHRTGDNCRVES